MIQEIIIESAPKSPISEAIKTIRTNMQFTDTKKAIKTIMITSSVSGEGKSFVSVNLAAAYAKTNKRVLLIDADMRRGRQHEIFGISSDKGYSNLLIDDVSKHYEYIQVTKVNNLYVLPRGVVPPNPSELIQSQNNKRLIDILSRIYDVIIFDGVPIGGLTDSVILSSLVDKTIIVCAANETPMEKLIQTKRILENVDCSIAGIIVNKVNDKKIYDNKYYFS